MDLMGHVGIYITQVRLPSFFQHSIQADSENEHRIF